MAHGHHHVDASAGDRRVGLAIAVNLGLTAAQVIGGIFAGSLALIADALHNFSDAIALIIAFGARRIARRPADAGMTFGYARAEVVAALVNYTTLAVLGLYLVYEAVLRVLDPSPVEGWLIVIIAGVALVVDLATAALTYAMSRTSVNIRAAFLHNLADAMGSLAVIVAGSLILLFGWTFVDPLVTLLIAGYILLQVGLETPKVIRILMLASPQDADTEAVRRDLAALDGVADVHNLRLWLVAEDQVALDAHLAIEPDRWGDADKVKADAKRSLAQRHGIRSTTLEIECARHVCHAPDAYGYD
ncbi:cation diffusion facilitator family transporter [Roseibacterium sp. SDUM158017]|uniref:cation diffusion facilitator family transporter n=1 Tax=Roseicyclus salinarum TaxID=3036773 RepID=UPI0024157473|nr:cation diffusion facilitator family transporter [Roseibacterium sp. SDUM158017]MDG4647929.1 cation diffusion facilitator family transporter [Roseibacterium sp. SDUM158017]